MVQGAFTPAAAGTVSLSVTTATASVAYLPDGGYGDVLLVQNSGSVAVFVALGVSGVTASATTGMPIPARGWVALRPNPYNTHLAAVTSSGTSTLYLTPGAGCLMGAGLTWPSS